MSNKRGFKHSSLGWIPEDWEIKRLGELGKVVSGLTYDPSHINEEGILVLRSSNIKNRRLDFSDNVYVKVNDGEYNPVQEGDILICVRNGSRELIGKNALITDKASGVAFGAFMAIFRSEDNPFLHHVFDTDTYLKEVHKNLGATINSINGSDLKLFKVPFPPKSERIKIAAILSTWDEAITKIQQLIAQLQQRNKGLMQQLLTAKESWKEVKLSDVFERVTRKNTEGNNTVVTISAQRGFVKQDDFFKKIVASDITDNYFLVHRGEFCYNKSYSKGYDWGATKRLKDLDKAVVTTLYICFRIQDEKQYSGDFFEFFFDACFLDPGLSKIAHEGGRAHGLLNVTPGDFFNLNIFVPDYAEQLRIFHILSAARSEEKLYEQKLAAMQHQKKGLMQKLLTGEVRVKI